MTKTEKNLMLRLLKALLECGQVDKAIEIINKALEETK